MPNQERETSGLEALSNAAILGDNVGNTETALVATTTKHPRHRPGCSCIVCIQPPSGKGKHKPTCTCNVCMTVKRRFKTLMMRKKKRQFEREAEVAQRNQIHQPPREEAEVDSSSNKIVSSQLDTTSENEARSVSELEPNKLAEIGKGHLDLNCIPDRQEMQTGVTRVSMVKLVQEASIHLDTYLKQNGLSLTSLMSEQATSSASQAPLAHLQGTGESEGRANEIGSANMETESGDEEKCEPEPDQKPNDSE